MCSNLRLADSDESAWNSREALFSTADNSVVAKFSVVPRQLGSFCDAVGRIVKHEWRIVAQSVGVGLLQVSCADAGALLPMIQQLRAETEKLGRLGQMSGGSLVALRCPKEMKTKLDVWGPAPDAQPLFASMKRQ